MFVTDKGFVPSFLTSIVLEDITFINETGRPQTLRFNISDLRILHLKPHGRRTFRPDGTMSIALHSDEAPKKTAYIQVETYFGPGEDPGAPDRVDADTPGERTYRPTPSP